MGQINRFFRENTQGFWHWCPACKDIHPLPWKTGGWTFNGNLEKPSFTPSFKQGGSGVAGGCCHYIITDGTINFCGDSTHELAGQSVPLADLPADLQDLKTSP